MSVAGSILSKVATPVASEMIVKWYGSSPSEYLPSKFDQLKPFPNGDIFYQNINRFKFTLAACLHRGHLFIVR